MGNVEQVLAVGGGLAIWVVTTVTTRVRRRVDPGSRPVTGPALATVWAAFFGSHHGLLALVDHSAAFRAEFGDAAATWSDVQSAVAPWFVVMAAVTLVSEVVGLGGRVAARDGAPSAEAGPAGQVPVADLTPGR